MFLAFRPYQRNHSPIAHAGFVRIPAAVENIRFLVVEFHSHPRVRERVPLRCERVRSPGQHHRSFHPKAARLTVSPAPRRPPSAKSPSSPFSFTYPYTTTSSRTSFPRSIRAISNFLGIGPHSHPRVREHEPLRCERVRVMAQQCIGTHSTVKCPTHVIKVALCLMSVNGFV